MSYRPLVFTIIRSGVLTKEIGFSMLYHLLKDHNEFMINKLIVYDDFETYFDHLNENLRGIQEFLKIL